MKNRIPIAISIAIVALMLGASVWVWFHIPTGTPVPIHWNIYGQADHYAKGPIGLFMAPAMAALIALLFIAIPVMEPRRLNLARSAAFYRASWIATLLLLATVHMAALYAATHGDIAVGNIVLASVSLLMIVIGNFLGKTRSMFLGGVRTPWTLSSEYSWQRTHSLAGKLFMLAGAAGCIGAITVPLKLDAEIFICAILAAVAISIVMSYVYWRNDPERDAAQ